MLKTLKRLFSSLFSTKNGWIEGNIQGYRYCLKAYQQPSELGINGSNISKLELWKGNALAVNYDRGWDIQPNTKELIGIVNELLGEFGLSGQDIKVSFPENDTKQSDEQLYNAMKELAVKRDISLFEAKMPKELRGFIAFGSEVTMIGISSSMPTIDKASTLAHELGHYMLHRTNPNGLLYDSDRGYHDIVEQEADAYGERLVRFMAGRCEN